MAILPRTPRVAIFHAPISAGQSRFFGVIPLWMINILFMPRELYTQLKWVRGGAWKIATHPHAGHFSWSKDAEPHATSHDASSG